MMLRKFAILGTAAGLLVACGGGGGGNSGSSGPAAPPVATAPVSALDASALVLIAQTPDQEPTPIAKVSAAEVDTLNPSSGGVTVASNDAADQQPLSGAQLPEPAADPEKPNS